ncbi:MAG TPA: dTDP-4-dehydrorhamnose 3,5-epimerase [Gemmatimonadales bacterium]|jgi:dTDP-4-dehydrorhamnose 3,5-epimerase
MEVTPLEISGVLRIELALHRDWRGRFVELWNDQRYRSAGIGRPFVQDNISVSDRGVLRGMHYQFPDGQGKLVSVVHGAVFDVVVDVRHASPTFGRWIGVELSDENGVQLYVPPGCAHGYLVVSERAVFNYKCTGYYSPQHEHTFRWDDPAVGIAWPTDAPPRLAAKDLDAPLLAAIPAHALPPMEL